MMENELGRKAEVDCEVELVCVFVESGLSQLQQLVQYHYYCKETHGGKSAHILCKQTGVTVLPHGAPGSNHRIHYAHTLPLTI